MKKDLIHTCQIILPTDTEINRICEIINSNLGFNYNAQKKYLIESRLNKRLVQLGITSYHEYLGLLKNEPLEQNVLYQHLTTNVTSFFREPAQFDYLRTVLLPEIRRVKKRKKFRAWSAGCSSGEEAYSLAITLMEVLGTEWDIKVLATDINAEKLQSGMSGEYTKETVNNIPLSWRQKYFKPQGKKDQSYTVNSQLRKKIVFRLMNLLTEEALPHTLHVDLIFCRNVFIYLSKEARENILKQFHDRLYSDGYLVLGHSESISDVRNQFWIPQGKSIYRKKD